LYTGRKKKKKKKKGNTCPDEALTGIIVVLAGKDCVGARDYFIDDAGINYSNDRVRIQLNFLDN
jgi:hypothetical protein